MILVFIAWFLLLADLWMTYRAIKLYGFGVESNRIMRALMKIDYQLVTVLTVLYMLIVLYCQIIDVIGFWGWVVIIGFNLSIFISNSIWFVKYYKR